MPRVYAPNAEATASAAGGVPAAADENYINTLAGAYK
jgi:hypothetical protein